MLIDILQKRDETIMVSLFLSEQIIFKILVKILLISAKLKLIFADGFRKIRHDLTIYRHDISKMIRYFSCGFDISL